MGQSGWIELEPGKSAASYSRVADCDSQARAQQRGLPHFIEELLDRYGEERHLGSGAVVRYLSKRGRRLMEHDMGRQPVAKLTQWLDTYEVSTTDGITITVGHRTRRLKCRS